MNATHQKIALGTVAALTWIVVNGCRITRVNEEHCNYNEGDEYCAENYPDGSFPFCESGHSGCISEQKTLGCVATRPEDGCYSPCGGDSTVLDDDSCVAVDSSDSGSSDTGEPTEGTTEVEPTDTGMSSGTTGPMPCLGNEDCTDDAAPLCDPQAGECVSCDALTDGNGDAACAELDPAMPACGDGECVECAAGVFEACVGDTPICDEAENTCVGCSEHGQCEEAACNLFTGACLPSDAVLHVGSGEMFGTIGAAVGSVAAEGEATVVVHQGEYGEAVVVDSTRTIAFLANEGDLPLWDLSGGGGSQLTVDSGATVLMDGLQVSGNGSVMNPGLAVSGGRAWVDRSRIVANFGGGIVASDGGELVLRNCFVGGNIDTDVLLVQSSTVEILYSTLGASLGESTAITCEGTSEVSLRNSVVVSRAAEPEVVCGNVSATNTASETALSGDGNVGLDDMNVSWFVEYNTGDFHLATPPAIIATAALWEDGDPLTDIDNQSRPAIDGATDVAGADVP